MPEKKGMLEFLAWLSQVCVYLVWTELSTGSASICDIAYRYGIDKILILNRKIDLESIRPSPLELLFYK
jgi:hypothetical protein